MKHFIYRVYQKVMYLLTFFLNFKEPVKINGTKSIYEIHTILTKFNIRRVMIVSDPFIRTTPFFESMVKNLEEHHICVSIYSEVKPNPSIQSIQLGYQSYLNDQCEALISIGGGSSMDFGKGVLIQSVYPKRNLSSFKGIIKVHRKLPLHIAIPTTTGTGSETTVACVVTDEITKEKYGINDPVLIPRCAVLDPIVTLGLPKKIVSTTGMDALTHAIEAYIGHANTIKTKKMAISAIQRIHQSLLNNYNSNEDDQVRMNMLLASYEAGVAFTRAYVGNVHALAHQLGGMYEVPHGLANAVLLPKVLRYYGSSVYKKLSEIEDYIHPENKLLPIEEKSNHLISWIEDLNQQMDIPNQLSVKYDLDEVKTMAQRAYQEANPLYPVPKIFEIEDFIKLYKESLIN